MKVQRLIKEERNTGSINSVGTVAKTYQGLEGNVSVQLGIRRERC